MAAACGSAVLFVERNPRVQLPALLLGAIVFLIISFGLANLNAAIIGITSKPDEPRGLQVATYSIAVILAYIAAGAIRKPM